MNWNREVEELLKDSASLDQENKDIREKRPPAAAILRLAHDLSRRPQTNFPFGTKMIFQKKKKVKNKWERGNPLMLYMLIVCVCRDVKMLPLECVGGSRTYLTDKKFL